MTINVKRTHFWDQGYVQERQGNCVAQPYLTDMGLLVGRDILEIGPGGMRQSGHLMRLCGSFAVADISAACLEQIPSAVPRFLIEDYETTDFASPMSFTMC